ncbi:hypothetical protein ACLMJK_005714 [Lecanora helva]
MGLFFSSPEEKIEKQKAKHEKKMAKEIEEQKAKEAKQKAEEEAEDRYQYARLSKAHADMKQWELEDDQRWQRLLAVGERIGREKALQTERIRSENQQKSINEQRRANGEGLKDSSLRP